MREDEEVLVARCAGEGALGIVVAGDGVIDADDRTDLAMDLESTDLGASDDLLARLRRALGAAAVRTSLGFRIYAIGVGTRGEAPVPTGVGPEGVRYQSLPVEIDEPRSSLPGAPLIPGPFRTHG